jgi:methionyl-tRNA formyltransferase
MLKNIVFMGTPEFAVPSLKLLAAGAFRPVLCITQPDRPKGRKRRLAPPPVKVAAQELGIDVIQPEDVNDAETIALLQELQPDVVVTVAYGGYLKKAIRRLPRHGCINLHPSLLPRYRGSAPINFALFNGDTTTGISIFRIVAAMDAGPLLRQQKVAIQPGECYTALQDRLAILGADEMLKVLSALAEGSVTPWQQNHDLATFSHKLTHPDFCLHWQKPAAEIVNRVRGLAEVPGAVAQFRQGTIKIIDVTPLNQKSASSPGCVMDVRKNEGIVVSTTDADLLITRVQPAGKKIMTAYAYHLGAQIESGELFSNGL